VGSAVRSPRQASDGLFEGLEGDVVADLVPVGCAEDRRSETLEQPERLVGDLREVNPFRSLLTRPDDFEQTVPLLPKCEDTGDCTDIGSAFRPAGVTLDSAAPVRFGVGRGLVLDNARGTEPDDDLRFIERIDGGEPMARSITGVTPARNPSPGRDDPLEAFCVSAGS